MGDPHKRSDPDHGAPGASARREHERRKANRQRRVRAAHPRAGGLLLALTGDPAHETAWARGASGEEEVARQLGKYLGDRVAVLHDRRIPGSRANIDHIAIAPSGVWVIDSKRYDGKVAVSRPLFGGRPKLTIGGRDRTLLAEGLSRQVAVVERAVSAVAADAVPVRGAMCFVDARLPRLRRLTIAGHALLYPRALARRIGTGGSLSDEQIRAITAQIARRFPRA